MQNHLHLFSTVFAVILFCTATSVLAHKVNIFAYVEGDTVFTESYFPDGKPAENGRILVQDEKGATLSEGKTDAKGLFSFPLPKKQDLVIIIDASMGHKNSYLLKESEME